MSVDQLISRENGQIRFLRMTGMSTSLGASNARGRRDERKVRAKPCIHERSAPMKDQRAHSNRNIRFRFKSSFFNKIQ